jgi:hypothetical protein
VNDRAYTVKGHSVDVTVFDSHLPKIRLFAAVNYAVKISSFCVTIV